jgi:hypothetical protein
MQKVILPSQLSREDKMDQIMKSLEQGIKDVFASDKFQNYLSVMSRFYRYSFSNCMLIMTQRPDSTFVAGFNAWKNDFNRYVKKGETGIRILAPAFIKKDIIADQRDSNGNLVLDNDGTPVKQISTIEIQNFKIVNVFDIGQTEGEPLPELATELKAKCDRADDFVKAICDVANCPVSFIDIPDGAKGYYDIVQHRIAIQKGMSDVQTIKTLCHELCHSRLHGYDAMKVQKKKKAEIETEAEAVAFVVTKHFGIDTDDYSFEYLAGWSTGADLKELSASLSLIQKEASSIITELTDKLKV